MWREFSRAVRTEGALHRLSRSLTGVGGAMVLGSLRVEAADDFMRSAPLDYGSAVLIKGGDSWRLGLMGLN